MEQQTDAPPPSLSVSPSRSVSLSLSLSFPLSKISQLKKKIKTGRSVSKNLPGAVYNQAVSGLKEKQG